MRRLGFALLVFGVAALMGPALRWVTWPPSRFEQAAGKEAAFFVYQLVFYLWPTQGLAAAEASVGWWRALLPALMGNLLAFLFLGLIVGACAETKGLVLALYGTHCVLLALLAFKLSDWMHPGPVIAAMALYAIPFFAVAARIRPTPPPGGGR